jgi:hypothetical protein
VVRSEGGLTGDGWGRHVSNDLECSADLSRSLPSSGRASERDVLGFEEWNDFSHYLTGRLFMGPRYRAMANAGWCYSEDRSVPLQSRSETYLT